MIMMNGLTIDNIIAIVAIIVPVVVSSIAAVYTLVTSTRKYELTQNYRIEIMDWYRTSVKILTDIIHYCQVGIFDSPNFIEKKTELLSQLSSAIEVGKFYFPNVIKGDSYGQEKMEAYQGYRHICLEFLYYFYVSASNEITAESIDKMWKLEKGFTSFLFKMIDPRVRNNEYAKFLTITLDKKNIMDYLAEYPQNREIF